MDGVSGPGSDVTLAGTRELTGLPDPGSLRGRPASPSGRGVGWSSCLVLPCWVSLAII